MKIVKNFQTEQEAAIYSISLKELGIESTILKTDGGPYPSLTDIYGYSLSVKDEDYQNAINHLPINMDIYDKKDIAIVKPESNTTEPAGKNWFLYGGLISGIVLGLLLNWLYSSFHYYVHSNKRYYYHNGEISKIVKDRNHDKKDDFWQIYHDDSHITILQDNNFDGKVDCWWEEKDFDAGVEKIDCDSNEIPDLTFYYVNNICRKSFIHPNNDKKNEIYREYSSLGILETEYVDSDSSGGFDLKRNYDPLGRLIKEEKIKDTIINNF